MNFQSPFLNIITIFWYRTFHRQRTLQWWLRFRVGRRQKRMLGGAIIFLQTERKICSYRTRGCICMLHAIYVNVYVYYMFIADIHLYLYACLHSWSRDKCFPSIFIYTYMYYIHLSYSFNPVLFASPSSTPSILNYLMAWWLFTKFCGTGVCSVSHVNLHVVPILDSHRRFVGAFYAKVKKTTVHEHSTKLHSPTNAYIVLLLLLLLLVAVVGPIWPSSSKMHCFCGFGSISTSRCWWSHSRFPLWIQLYLWLTNWTPWASSSESNPFFWRRKKG